jgi:hypothetical protein
MAVYNRAHRDRKFLSVDSGRFPRTRARARSRIRSRVVSKDRARERERERENEHGNEISKPAYTTGGTAAFCPGPHRNRPAVNAE